MRKSVAFLDDAEYRGKNTPSFYSVKDVKKRILTPNFKKYGKERETKIVKKGGKTQYDMVSSYNKTQVATRTYVFKKGKRFEEIEKALKRKAFVPAPGHYNIESAERSACKHFGPQRR